MTELEARIARAARHWDLTVGERLTGGTSSAVHAVTDREGRDLVLKLPRARDDATAVTAAEAAALTAWGTTGASVRLLDATPDALLLVRARPGTNAPWQPDTSIEDLAGIAADLLGRLWSADPGRYGFGQLAEVYLHDEQIAREDAAYEQQARGEPGRGSAGLSQLPAAAAAAGRMISTIDRPTLLHGDFITKNLIRDDSAPVGWIAIDPLPMIGDRACDVAAFAAYQPAGLILPIAEQLAREAAVSVRRALVWAAIWAVHQSAQAWRDDQEDVDRLVGSRRIGELLDS